MCISVSQQSNATALHYFLLGLGFEGKRRFDKITSKKKKTSHRPTGFNTVQFHELTLIDSGLPPSSWRQSITSTAHVECNTATS